MLLTRRRLLAATTMAALSLAAGSQPLTEEVPFITSPDNVTLEMLRIAQVGARDHVIDLGSGDGRIVILAARRFGASGLGVEIVPDLVQQSRKSARDAGVADRVEFREQDLFQTDLSRATVVTMYLLPEFNLRLRPTLLALKPGTRVVSHDWDMGDWKPDQTTQVAVPDKKVGLDKFSRIHLWTVPARVAGTWCSVPGQPPARLEVAQQYQEVQARLTRGGATHEVSGRIHGSAVDLGDTLRLQAHGDTLRAGSATAFVRAPAGGCPAG